MTAVDVAGSSGPPGQSPSFGPAEAGAAVRASAHAVTTSTAVRSRLGGPPGPGIRRGRAARPRRGKDALPDGARAGLRPPDQQTWFKKGYASMAEPITVYPYGER